MAKGKKAKPKNLKFRKQIRYTLGALFMVSAIAVALVPVQRADADTSSSSGNSTKRDNIETEANNRAQLNYEVDIATATETNLDPNGILDKSTASDYTSYVIRELTDGSWSLNWQYRFYVTTVNGSERAVISKYNNVYPEKMVTLANTANYEYYKVTDTKFKNFYNDPTRLTGGYTYTMNYDDFLAYQNNGVCPDTAGHDMKWFDESTIDSVKTMYTAFIAKCEEYKTAKETYDTDHAAWDVAKAAYDQYLLDKAAYDALPDKTGHTEPTAVADPGVEPTLTLTQPTAIAITPKDGFTVAEKLKYYCTCDNALATYGTGYTLVAVTDNTDATETSGGTAKIIYVAKDGIPNSGYQNDLQGFLVTKRSKEIIGIGNNAFAKISNVDELSVPSEIAYIGKEAFKDSFIKKISMANVENVGHRAFSGCSQLTDVTLSGTKAIGNESFQGSGLTSVTFPYSLSEVGAGAFASCRNLTNVDFNAVASACEVKDYCFYNCYALNSVNMENSGIVALGKGAFSVASTPTGSWTNAVLPTHMPSLFGGISATNSSIGDLLFAGRINLNTVKFPSDYGTSTAVTVPSGIFRNCVNLEKVDFTTGRGSTICGNVSYSPALFYDVTNENLKVYGPERTIAGTTAEPRKSTWASVSAKLDNIPYIYIDSNGVECYEVSDGTYLLQANERGELSSCTLVDETATTPIHLVIPGQVGDYKVTSIAPGCFANENLRNRIVDITIEDDSLTTIGDKVFANLPNVEWVEIGNSVQSIGARAFNNCPKLIDVTFHTPLVGYAGFTIGQDAFLTNSNDLTLHGDIATGYAPFEFAVGADSGKIDENGKRICYKSLSPDFLTVMYDNASGEVTLLDYPKYDELDNLHSSYCDTMETNYYAKYGDTANPRYNSLRDEFAAMWVAAVAAADPATAMENAYKSTSYGPWITPDYVKADATSGFSQYLTNPDPDITCGIYPKAFYEQQPYSIVENYERGSSARGEYESVTDTELQWIAATLNIVVPSGVTSIDATGFFKATENTRNVSTYFDTSSKSYRMCTEPATEVVDGVTITTVPGLFSGTYDDYAADSPYETMEKGNDRVETIILNSVKKLPDYAFDNCERLNTVVLGAACEDIGTAPFRACPLLTSVTGNEYFAASNGLVYSVNDDGSFTIEECLSARGTGVGESYINSTTDPNIAGVSAIAEGAFEDCDGISKVYLTDANKLTVIPKDCFKDCEILTTVDLPDSTKRIEEDAFANDLSLEVTIPAAEVVIATDAFEHDPRVTIAAYKDSAPLEYADYYGLSSVILDDKFKVEFLDYDGSSLGDAQYVETGKSATPPADPIRTGYTFKGWSDDYTNVTKNLVLIAQYISNTDDELKHTVTFYNYDDTVVSTQKVNDGESAVAPLAPARAGYTFTGWKPTTYTNVTRDLDIYAQFINNSGSSTTTTSPSGGSSVVPVVQSSASPSPSATPTPAATKYTVSVSGGSGSGTYAAGTLVTINAFATSGGMTFDKWTTSSAGVGFVDASNANTSFTMPASNVAITATYKNGNGTAATTGTGTGATNNATNTATGNTTTGTTANGDSIEVTKPGISNVGLAAANVNGSTDNYVVKVTEDANAASAAKQALEKEYGDISAIKYLPMDISLYDSTGRTKITDTAGITVDVTLPLPDDLVGYAGNNMVASVAGGTIEKLGSRFTTIDGVPCITFTANHFSPYMIYVDTANLTEGTIDATPKTGDLIHPKWFLAMGLACISLILFFKRDKAFMKIKTI